MGVERKVLREGNGPKPKAGQTVVTQMIGMLGGSHNRKQFWSTYTTQEFTFQVGVGGVIKGMDEGVLAMSVGEKAELIMTSDYGYGPAGFPAWGIPPNTELIFQVELVKIK
jgi:peptidylprolyl isomerase